MHYTIDYNATPEGEKRTAKALKDCKEWLGAKRYREILKTLRMDNGRTSRNLIVLGLSMNGIQGYPAQVLIDEFWSPQRDLFDEV